MLCNRMPLVYDKRGCPIEFSELRWSSAQTPWSGFRLEAHRLAPSGLLTEFAPRQTLLGMCTAGLSRMESRTGKTHYRAVSVPGTLVLVGRGYEQNSLSWSGTREVLFAEVDTQRVRQWTGQENDLSHLLISHQFVIRDPQLSNLLLSMRVEIKAGCPTGKLYGESLSLALAACLLGRYSAKGPKTDRLKARLSPSQLQQVRDYVQVHLESELSLNELASIIQLSPHHFCRLFKNTLDITPHRYVLCERISESKRLLATGRMSLIEVALTLGFADQSHFTEVFRKVTGTTPKRYQKVHAPSVVIHGRVQAAPTPS